MEAAMRVQMVGPTVELAMVEATAGVHQNQTRIFAYGWVSSVVAALTGMTTAAFIVP